ncbi:hypothetical protein H0H87_001601 [Tephrocybe sp. NHM501043]|nr:hypothetical protein H0H87_001601 [Tephrocybe sp. NHM501043]
MRMKHDPREDETKLRGDGRQEVLLREVRDTLEDEKEKNKEGARGAFVGEGFQSDPVRSGIDNTDTSRLESTARGIAGDERVDRARDTGERTGQETHAQAGEMMDENVEGEVKKQGFMERMRGVKENFSDRVPQEHRDRMDRGKQFLSEDYFPPERRDQFIYRGKKVCSFPVSIARWI